MPGLGWILALGWTHLGVFKTSATQTRPQGQVDLSAPELGPANFVSKPPTVNSQA